MTTDHRIRPTDQAVSRMDVAEGRAELLEKIVMSAPVTDRAGTSLRPVRSRRGRRWTVVVAAALTVALGVPAYLNELDHGTRSEAGQTEEPNGSVTPIHYTAAVIKAAERNPRLLITAPGWRVVDVSGFRSDEGEITYQNAAGSHWVKLYWSPTEHYADAIAAREAEYPSLRMPGLGGRLTVYDMEGADYEAIVPARRGEKAYATLRVTGRAEMATVLASLERADVTTWLESLPRKVVRPDGQGTATSRILRGVPLPPGFDQAALPDLGTNTEYHLATKVIDRVVCGWMVQYDAGGEARTKALDALGSSPHWPILRRMRTAGDYPEFIWDFADQLAKGTLPQGARDSLDCG